MRVRSGKHLQNMIILHYIYDPYMNHQTFQTIAGNKIQGLRFWNAQGHQDKIPWAEIWHFIN